MRLQDDPERRSGIRRSLRDAEVVDTRRASTVGRYDAVSRRLYEALRETLAGQGRAVLYVNRRGLAALTICRTCAHVFECPRCSTGLVQHRQTRQIVCHICNWRGPVPRWCPVCEGDRLRLWGYGSEAVAEAVTHLLPRAAVARLTATARRTTWTPDLTASSEARCTSWWAPSACSATANASGPTCWASCKPTSGCSSRLPGA